MNSNTMEILPLAITGFFALVGMVATTYFVYSWTRKAWEVLCGLNATLREAVELMKAHRGDLQVLRQINDMAAAQVAEEQPIPDVIGEKRRQAAVAYPTPPWEYFRTEEKPPEPDAPDEGMCSVDVTGDEQELIDVEKVEILRAMGMSAPDPEFRPKAVEVDSE